MPRAPRTARVLRALRQIAPERLAEAWDNVGLIAGDGAWRCRGVLLAIDTTGAVIDEAAGRRCDLIVSYHPPLFKPVSRLDGGSGETDALVVRALGERISIYSPHTAFDAADGGANDALAGLCGLTDCRPVAAAAAPGRCKLVVFVPPEALDRVANALFDAGAGWIGNYSSCSYRTQGTGTFYGEAGARPVVGQAGRLEQVDEVRIETICDRGRLAEAIGALRSAHPYEEPAFDVYALEPLAEPRRGQGRIGRPSRPVTLAGLARKLSVALRPHAGRVTVATIGRAGTKLRRVMVVVGSAGGFPFEPHAGVEPLGAGDAVVTGEVRHHDALRYARHGIGVVAVGHWASERPGLMALQRQLAAALPGLPVHVSRADRDPFAAPAPRSR